jgi:hypothetical protein
VNITTFERHWCDQRSISIISIEVQPCPKKNMNVYMKLVCIRC